MKVLMNNYYFNCYCCHYRCYSHYFRYVNANYYWYIFHSIANFGSPPNNKYPPALQLCCIAILWRWSVCLIWQDNCFQGLLEIGCNWNAMQLNWKNIWRCSYIILLHLTYLFGYPRQSCLPCMWRERAAACCRYWELGSNLFGSSDMFL